MFTLQRGVRHDQHVLVYMGVRYDVASAPKNCGGRPGVGAGQNLLILIDCLSLFPSRSSLRNTYVVTY